MKPLMFLFVLLASVNLYSESITLQLKWYHQFQFAGFYMAEEKGFYNEVQLDVTIREGGPLIDTAMQIKNGNAQFGVLGSELLILQAREKNIVAISPIMQHSIRAIIANRDKGIFTLSDLLDKKIQLNLFELPEFQAMLAYEGIDIKNLNIEPKNPESNSLFIEGSIDALNGSIANQPFLFKTKNMDLSIFRPITYGVDFYGDTIFTSSSYARFHKDTVEKFRDASIKGWQYAFANPEETIEVIVNEYGTKKTADQLLFEYETLKNLITPELVEIGHNNPLRWKHIQEIYLQHGIIDKPIDLDRFLFNPELKRKQTLKLIVIISSVFASTFLVIIIAGLIWTGKLNSLVALRTAQLSSIIESLPIILIGIDCNGKITTWNKQAQEASGISADKALGKEMYSLFPFLLEMKNEIISATENKEIIRERKHKSNINGKIQYRDISLYPISNNATHCYVLKIEDVTKQIEQSELLARNEKLLSLGKMAEGLAHEINNPLGGIIQSSSVLRDRLYKRWDSKKNLSVAEETGISFVRMAEFMRKRNIPALLDNIKESVRRISLIVDSFLSFSGHCSEAVTEILLQQLLTETLELLTRKNNRDSYMDISAIQVIKNYPDRPVKIHSYREKLQKVLMNILQNGFQAMSGSDRDDWILITTIEDDEEIVKIHIKDNGFGMPEEIQRKIFDPFFTTKEPGKGTGLGLSLSYQIIKKYLQGNLTVHSEPEKGTHFLIELPKGIDPEP